ncbi:MAG: S41 family peptidase [Deltaproteobacteria bacterium]
MNIPRWVNALRQAVVLFCVLFSVFVLATLAVSGVLPQKEKGATYKELELFADALAFVETQYVHEVDPKKLIYGAMAGLLSDLDPHSQFLTPEEYDELKIDTEGKFGGVGVEITMKDNLLTVITPIEGTPAWEAGLQPNDRIVKIDATVVRNFTLNDAVKVLRGKPGSEVQIVAWREKEGKLLTFKMKRAIIQIKDIKEARILEDGIAYLRLVEFREDTPRELDRTLKDFREKGMKSLIVDLRNNPGGLLDQAIDVTKRFLPRGSVLVTVRGRDPEKKESFTSDFSHPDTATPLVLLINEGSASGSEIMAGALRDYKRAVLIGSPSFGKGSIQTVFPLPDGSAMKLTTNYYLTPSGEQIQEKGITPDIVVGAPPAEEKAAPCAPDVPEAIFEKVEPPAQEAAPEPAASSDPALQRAIDLLKSLKVFEKLGRVQEPAAS